MLRAITRALGLPFDSNRTLVEAAGRLHDHLLAERMCGDQWTALSNEGRSAWLALLETEGETRSEDWCRHFGRIRPYMPWRADALQAPWQDSPSPAEEVLYRGLAFEVNQGTTEHPVWTIVLPDEYVPVLAGLAALATPARRPPPASLPSATPSVVDDLFVLLSLLNRRDVRPIWGRWLPPTAVRELGRRLRQPLEPESVRSERSVSTIAFLHYLAERARQIEAARGLLKPTLIAQEWLAAPLRQRLSALWESWIREESEGATSREDTLWALYRLPGSEIDDMPGRFRRLRGVACARGGFFDTGHGRAAAHAKAFDE